MRAAIYRQFCRPISVEEVAERDLPDDGVVIRVAANGICRSDWHEWQGHDSDIRLPHVPGHEHRFSAGRGRNDYPVLPCQLMTQDDTSCCLDTTS